MFIWLSTLPHPLPHPLFWGLAIEKAHTLTFLPLPNTHVLMHTLLSVFTSAYLAIFLSQDEDGSPTQLNEQITNRLWQEMISPLLEPCRSAAETLLCHYAFPSCSFSPGQPSKKPLCREDCVAVRDLFCYNEWAMVEENNRKGIYFKNRAHFRLPDCDSLPSHGNQSDPPCTHASLTSIKLDEVTYTCIKGHGRFYQGPVNVTKTGLPCQRWDAQEPHSHNRPPFVFPEIWNSENYCRNAGGEEPVPWCYTRDPRTRWQHCDIPICGMCLFFVGCCFLYGPIFSSLLPASAFFFDSGMQLMRPLAILHEEKNDNLLLIVMDILTASASHWPLFFSSS